MAHPIKEGEHPVKEKTALGGFFTLSGIVALLAVWAILAIQREGDNVLRLVVVSGVAGSTLAVAQRSAPAVAPAAAANQESSPSSGDGGG